ncbi:hypothetical protein PR048_021536 [Dryococelus australis]|uniref:Uncharacterized protein n=1 Tax=Dryococelus australis TaxID=614101 RepID=A0ABQ9GYH0_9NEOP|nr:hypothetical protein PR048_021536 [Dryococelus australis]
MSAKVKLSPDGVAAECKARGNGSDPRKPAGRQRPPRFPHAKILVTSAGFEPGTPFVSSTARLIEASFLRKYSTPVHCLVRMVCETCDVRAWVAPSVLLGLGHANYQVMVDMPMTRATSRKGHIEGDMSRLTSSSLSLALSRPTCRT